MTDEPTPFMDYWKAVDTAMLKFFGIDTSDAGIDADLIASAQEECQTAEEFARWYGDKHDLTYLNDWKTLYEIGNAASQPQEQTITKTAKLSERDLSQFTGSENWYRHGINREVLFTDGAKYVADEGGAYWLLDAIAICQRHEKRVAAEPFQVWKLMVREDRTASLVCDDGNDNIVFTQHIEFTDFPADQITLWFANGVIYLPSEH